MGPLNENIHTGDKQLVTPLVDLIHLNFPPESPCTADIRVGVKSLYPSPFVLLRQNGKGQAQKVQVLQL